MHSIIVGELYHPDRKLWPERADYNYRAGSHELRLFLSSPTSTEAESVSRGDAEFGLLVEESVIFLLYRFGTGRSGIPWGDAAYNWWLVREDERTLPNPEPTALERPLVSVLLIDSTTGILRAMRTCTWSPEFYRAINAAIRDQADTPFNERAHVAAIERVYERFPGGAGTAAMAEAASARCKGGD